MNMIQAIGGYFELELRKGMELHNNSIHLNSGRNCLKYILSVKNYKKIFIPFYICDSIVNVIKGLGLSISYYHLDKYFKPIADCPLKNNEVFLYVNYFGLMEKNVNNLARKYKNIIIDNCQAFYSPPRKGTDTIYSPRKYFGVADGGYLYTDKQTGHIEMIESSFNRCKHLLIRLDSTPEQGYKYFLDNEKYIAKQDIKYMSNLTKKILDSINYKKAARIRINNYNCYDKYLRKYNELANIIDLRNCVPMIYPLLNNKCGLREYLINNKIYNAHYWPEVSNNVSKGKYEYYLTKNLISLPLDQRCSLKEIEKVSELVLDYLNK